MNTNTKSTKTEAEATEATYCPAAYATLLNKGLEKVVAATKTSLDLAVEQNTEVLASYKKAMKASAVPGLFWFDLAGQAFDSYVSLQKNLLDLAVEQTTAFVDASKELSVNPTKAGVSSLIQQSVERTVAAQKSVLAFAAGQTKEVSDALKQQPGISGTPAESVADSVQRGVDTVLATQKEMLDIASKTMKASAAKA
jgi:hypothetical protein